MDITIGNKEYFYMVDNKIRDTMMEYEERVLLPKAKKLASDSGIDKMLEVYPIDGYYYKTLGLRNYLTIIRNIQENEELYDKIAKTNDLEFLKKITGSKLFGTVRSNRTESPLPKMKDIMTLCMEDKKLFPEYAHHSWTIPKILDNLSRYATRNPNLVKLAYLTGETECLVAGCETNILYREHVIISGCASMSFDEPEIEWIVDKEVEDLGAKLISRYNELIGSKMLVPNIDNFQEFDRIPELPRVAKLGFQINTEEWYYWILEENRNVFDKYSTKGITTESYKSNRNV